VLMKTSKLIGIGATILPLLLSSAAFGQPAAAQGPSGQRPTAAAAAGGRGAARGPRVVSPEILPDKQVTFRLLAPKASEVTLTGHWENGTNIPLTKDDQGIWSVTVGPLGEQLWGYSFTVDGVKVLDPGNAELQRDGTATRTYSWVPGRRIRQPMPSVWAKGTGAKPPAIEGLTRRRFWRNAAYAL